MLAFYLSLVKTDEERSKMEALYNEYKRLMLFVGRRILRDQFLAEDAVHEAFIKLSRHLNGIEEIKSHKTAHFIVIIVKHVSLDMLDKLKRRPATSFEDIECCYGIESNILDSIEAHEIRSLIKQLPEIYRDALQLKVYYDLPDKAIADILCISNQALRKRLQRAREALKKLLIERGGY